MQKVLEFTEEQKSLIWVTKVNPVKGTPEECAAFVMVCEEYGLNPLAGDISFQRYETDYGPRVSYIIARDGYLKHLYRQSDFVSINSGVVREGDHFKYDLNNEVIEHSFGAKRGPVIGSWALLKTKNRGNFMDFADYNEYKEAIGPKNKLWYKMPSAMIKKVAQSIVIKLAFPLGVNFVTEDEIDNIETSDTESKDNVSQPAQEKSDLVVELEQAKEEAFKQPQKTEEKAKPKSNPQIKPSVTESKKQQVGQAEDDKMQHPQKTPNKETIEDLTNGADVASEETKTDSEEVQTNVVQSQPQSEKIVLPPVSENVFVFTHAELNTLPSNNDRILKIKAVRNGQEELLFAGGEFIFAFDEFVPGTHFEANLSSKNGFNFVEGVKVMAV